MLFVQWVSCGVEQLFWALCFDLQFVGCPTFEIGWHLLFTIIPLYRDSASNLFRFSANECIAGYFLLACRSLKSIVTVYGERGCACGETKSNHHSSLRQWRLSPQNKTHLMGITCGVPGKFKDNLGIICGKLGDNLWGISGKGLAHGKDRLPIGQWQGNA